MAVQIDYPYPFTGFNSLTFTNGYWGGRMQALDFEEIQRRFQRICQMAWYHFTCHDFAKTFRLRVWELLKNPRPDEVCRQIDQSYENSHTRNWQLICLHECRGLVQATLPRARLGLLRLRGAVSRKTPGVRRRGAGRR